MDLDKLNTERTIKTYTGKYIDVFDPNPDDIVIEDIAKALSYTARWGGHTECFYSVASHAIWVMHNVPDEYALEALLHDATEAYIGDMPKPIKRHLPDFNKLEAGLDKVIRKKFGLPIKMSAIVKETDKRALEYEWKYEKNTTHEFSNSSPGGVENEFLEWYYFLTIK